MNKLTTAISTKVLVTGATALLWASSCSSANPPAPADAGTGGAPGRTDASVRRDGFSASDVGPLPPDAATADGGGPADGGDPSPYGLRERPANATCKPPNPINRPAELLSQTGCLDPQDPREPAPGLIPYDVASPLWSDGAVKRRYFALPDGQTITIKDCTTAPETCRPVAEGGTPEDVGHFSLPVGSVLVKSFEIGGRMIETRLLVRVSALTWRGFSYEWNEAQTDATLLPDMVGGLKKLVPTGQGAETQIWHFPSRAQCLQCHTAGAGVSLGLASNQLDIDFQYPSGVTSNQLETLAHIGVFEKPPAAASGSPVLADPADEALPLQDRVRSYLHANCSNCHRPQGGYEEVDLRRETPFAALGICNVLPMRGNLGVADARLLVPGQPEKSLMSLRMHSVERERMPQIGTSVVDPVGVVLVDGWIRSLDSCP